MRMLDICKNFQKFYWRYWVNQGKRKKEDNVYKMFKKRHPEDLKSIREYFDAATKNLKPLKEQKKRV